jgi:hypothetical protein
VVAAYLARHAFMAGSDGAAQVSKPGTTLPGVAGGAGTGLLASTGPVGFLHHFPDHEPDDKERHCRVFCRLRTVAQELLGSRACGMARPTVRW